MYSAKLLFFLPLDDSDMEKVYEENFDVYTSVDPLKDSTCFADDKISFWLGLRKKSDGNYMNLYQNNETVTIKDYVGGHDCIYMQGRVMDQSSEEEV